MAKNDTTNNTPEVQEVKYEDVFIYKSSELDDPNDLVCINGKNYVIPKGKTTKVPDFVKAEIERSRRAQEKLDNKIDALVAEASK